MKVTCPSCRTSYNIDDKRLPAGGAKLKCAKCQATFPVKPGEPEAVALPPPQPIRSRTVEMPAPVAQALREASAAPTTGNDLGAIPLPPARNTRRMDFGFDEPTVTRTRPVADPFGLDEGPGPDTDAGAVPLPGAPPSSPAAPLPSASEDPFAGAIPLPGQGSPYPDDTAFGEEVDPDAATRAVPLPGDGAFGFPPPPTDAVPLPGGYAQADSFGAEPDPGTEAVPLPGDDAHAGSFGAVPDASADAFGPDAFAGAPDAGAEAVPLPGGYADTGSFADAPDANADAFGAEPGASTEAVPLPGDDAHAGSFGAEPDAGADAFGSGAFAGAPDAGTEAVPLPGGYAEAGAFADAPDSSAEAIPLPGQSADADPFGAEPDAGADAFAAAPDASAEAVPLPGDADAPTQALPLPGASSSDPFGASSPFDLPPPGHSDAGFADFGEEPAHDAVPLPGSPADFGVGSSDDDVSFDQPTRVMQRPADPVTASQPSPFAEPPPLSGDAEFVDESDFSSVDSGPHPVVPVPAPAPQSAGGFDFSALEPTPQGSAFSAFDALPPLEGESAGGTAVTRVPPPVPLPAALDDFGSEDDTFNEPTRVAPIPDLDKLRAASLHADPSRLAPAAPPAAVDDPFADLPLPSVAPAVPSSDDPFADLPLPVNAPPSQASVDDPFADLPAASGADPFAALPPAPPPASSDPFADLPSPHAPAAAAPDDPFADLPSPHASAEPAPVDDPFAQLAPPPAPAPAPSFNPSLDFGGVDLAGDPEPEPAAFPEPPSGGGDDPFASISLEAHETKQIPTGNPSHHLRARNGQVSGPFDDEKILELLGSGQLLGNEEISQDGSSWSPIGSVPAFQAVIERAAAGARASGTSTPAPGAADPMDRLKQMYGGRMAAVSVVERKDPLLKVRARLKPLLIAAGVLVVLAGGLSVGLTRYGPFGIKYFAPAKISSGSSAATEIANARKAIAQDTFDGYRKARAAAEKVLAIREYPEARAVWCQAIFYLDRRYAAATPGDLQHAREALEDIELLGKKNPDVAKAYAGAALAARHPEEAVSLLQEAIARDPNQDPELSLLLAEATSAQGQPKEAIATLERLTSKGAKSAKAFHALGDLYQAQKDAAKATQAYQKALAIDPLHVISDVELAAVGLLVDKKVEDAQKALDAALDPKNKAQMGPAELARAKALQGYAFAEQFKLPEAAAVLEEALKADRDSLFAKATLARVYLAQHNYEKALPLFQEAQRRDPHNLEYTDGYLSSLIATGKMSDALEAVAQASGRFPDNARIAFLTARVNDALEHTSDAERHYRRALSADPTMVDAYIYLGRLYLRGKRLDDAGKLLETAAEKAPDSAAVHAGLGELRLAKGDPASAEGEFQKAVTLDPTLAVAHLGLAGVDLAMGKLDVAKTEAEKALSLDAHLQNAHLQLGRILWKQGALKEALAQLELAKQESPDSGPVAVAIGAVKLAQDDLAGAESSLLLALGKDPLDPEGHYYLGQVKLAEGQVTQAVDQLHSALDRAPKNAAYRFQLGRALKASKDVAGAITEWEKAAELDPKNADAFEALGKTYLDQGRFDEAVTAFNAGLKADPTRSEIYALQGDAYFQATRWRDAISRYQAAIKADSKLVAVYYKIGRAYGESGQPNEAIRWYQKATETDPTNAMPYYYLGFAYKEHGRKQEAISAFKLYLAKKPDAPDRRDIEDEIYDLGQPL